MEIKILKTDRDYKKALKRADEIFDANPNTPQGNELALLLLVIKDYEDKNHPVPIPDPIEVIKLKMEEEGLKPKDLYKIIGSKSYVSQVLSKKKPLTAGMMKALNKKLHIPAEILLS